MDKIRVPLHDRYRTGQRLVAFTLSAGALVLALAAWGFLSVIWFLTHSD